MEVYVQGSLIATLSKQISYGSVALPNLRVLGFSPDSSRVKLLLSPIKTCMVDVRIELINGSDIIYAESKKDISVIQPAELNINWPILLKKNQPYTVRAKIFSQTQPMLTASYVVNFTAVEDAEIKDDVDADEFGASVTVVGKSQVPLNAELWFLVEQKGREIKTIKKPIPIIMSGKDETVGANWENEFGVGVYDLKILVVAGDRVIDRYETVFEVKTPPYTVAPTPTQKMPGFEFAFALLGTGIVALLGRERGHA